jgi:7,8-dihydropterin-6-yl-methyl-4-(beta-D-ribofuranosyl)aminobenzene 5'-phosphate synthase
MKIKATVLVENCVFFHAGAIAEHGWAVYLETDQGNFLFDTGEGKGITNNAHYFDKDLSNLQGIILSHHHHDHTGGLLQVLEYTGKIKVYAHPDLFKNSYSARDGVEKNIGIPFRREILESKGAEFIFNTDVTEIVPGLLLSGEIPRKTSFETGDTKLLLKNEKGYVQDIMPDDQTLIAKTSKGLVIILGCSHSGIINIIDYAIEQTGEEHIHTVFGGTHLDRASEETKSKTIEALKKFDIEKIGTSHCTGLEAAMQLHQEFGKRFFFCNVGTVVEV